MTSSDEKIGALRSDVVTLQKQSDDLFQKNDKRRTDIEDLNLRFVRLMDQLEETSAQVSGQTKLFEQIHSDVQDLTANVGKLTIEVDGVKNDVNEIKANRFNWSKFMSGLVSKAGVLWIICVTIIVLVLSGFGEYIPQLLKFKV